MPDKYLLIQYLSDTEFVLVIYPGYHYRSIMTQDEAEEMLQKMQPIYPGYKFVIIPCPTELLKGETQ